MDEQITQKQLDEKKQAKIELKNYKRHKRIWNFAAYAVRPFLKMSVNFTPKTAPKLDGPFILLSNHTTDLDPIIVGSCFPGQQMYFIASEQVYRTGFKSKLLYWSFQPISKIKGASDKMTVMKTLRYLKEGKNVALFPEGNRTFNGMTGEILEATGKMVKVSGANLVTFKIEGGYFTYPRWGISKRKGKMTAGMVNYYSREDLKNMSLQELTEKIRNDIDEKAWEVQEKNPIPFKGKELAKGMECSIAVCPNCNSMKDMKSHDNRIFCTNCNEGTEINNLGFFKDGFKFKTIAQWDQWQHSYIKEFIQKQQDENAFLFEDKGMTLKTVDSNHNTVILGQGAFKMFKNRFEFIPTEEEKEPLIFPIAEVPDVSIFAKSVFNFSDKAGVHYEMRPENEFTNMRKYIFAWSFIRQTSAS